jgi:hypothetical protein
MSSKASRKSNRAATPAASAAAKSSLLRSNTATLVSLPSASRVSRVKQPQTPPSSASLAASSALSRSASVAVAPSSAAPATRNSNVTRIARDLLQLSTAAGSRASTAAASGYAASPSFVSSVSAASSSAAAQSVNQQYLSDLERQILNAKSPLSVQSSEEIEVNGLKGQYLNKSEVVNWKGDLPIEEYEINVDEEPEVINKKANQKLEYVQELAVKYLRPPTYKIAFSYLILI